MIDSPPSSRKRLGSYVPLVREFSAGVVLYHEAVGSCLGLHATDVKALRLLEAEPMTASALAEATGLTNAAVTALVDRLEHGGYVERLRDAADRRRVTVRPIPGALGDLDRLYERQSAEIGALLDAYSDAEFATICSYLEKAAPILRAEARALRTSHSVR